MNPIIRNIIAVVVGIFVGGAVNMAIVTISGSVIPLPEGVDPKDMDSIMAHMPSYQPEHFIMPFLAHAIGTLVGALLAALIAGSKKMTFALVVGVFFLLGGITNNFMLPAPTWFETVDLVFAYLPMAWIGGKLGARRS